MTTHQVDQPVVLTPDEARSRRRAERFRNLLEDQRRLTTPDRAGLTEEARRSVVEFERDVAALDTLVDAEWESLVPFPSPVAPDAMDAGSDPLHVFGPGSVSLRRVHLDHGHASVDLERGSIAASNYTIHNARFSVAEIGVPFRPTVPVCRLSVRAYVRYSGYSILDHRVHQPGSSEQRRAWALGSAGMKVESRSLDGSDFHLDAERWVDLWDRGEVNPSGQRDHDGSASVSDGMIVEPLAVNSRNYEIWMTCRVGVSADHGFEVSTYATSSIGCQVVYFVVEEMTDW